MMKIVDLLLEIRRLAENSSPVIYDLSQEALNYLNDNILYTKEEVMRTLDRRDDE